MLYLHGGGFVAGSLDEADVTARALAAQARIAVLSLDYSLAPRHPFPAAPEDAHAALRWLARHAADLRLDAQRLAVAGDDAGGNIAAAAALIARDRNGPALAAQVLIGPMLDPEHDAARRRRALALGPQAADLRLSATRNTCRAPRNACTPTPRR